MKITDDCYGVLICDVMGHGVRSALIVAMLRGLLEKRRARTAEPGLFLQGLNESLSAILERAGTTMFATAFSGVIELAAGTFKYACAGHCRQERCPPTRWNPCSMACSPASWRFPKAIVSMTMCVC